MKILIDARMVSETYNGIARYVVLLAKGLREIKNQKGLTYRPVFLVRKGFLDSLASVLFPESAKSFSGFETIEAESSFLHPREVFEIPRILKTHKISLYHSPSFSSLLYSPCPWIVTVHDLNHLQFGGIKEKIYYHFLLKRFSKKATQLLTVSGFSRKELSKWLGMDERKIKVVYNAIDPFFDFPMPQSQMDSILSGFKLKNKEYFICLSNSKKHKNTKLLVTAYLKFKKENKNAPPLVLCLGTKYYKSTTSVIFLNSLSELETKALLSGAKAVFFPSLYEGFGLPPLEGAVCGSPIVVSEIAPHLEALSDVPPSEVHFVQAKDYYGWVQAFSRVMKKEVLPPSLDTQARLLERFSVIRLGETMDGVYKEILEGIL